MTVDNLKLKYSKNSTLGKFIKQFEAEKDLNLDEFFNLLFETYLTKRYLVDIVDFVNSYEILLNFVKAKTYFLDNYYPEINTGQRLYHLYSKDYKVYFCPICNKPLKWKKGRKFDTFYNDFKNNYYLHLLPLTYYNIFHTLNHYNIFYSPLNMYQIYNYNHLDIFY